MTDKIVKYKNVDFEKISYGAYRRIYYSHKNKQSDMVVQFPKLKIVKVKQHSITVNIDPKTKFYLWLLKMDKHHKDKMTSDIYKSPIEVCLLDDEPSTVLELILADNFMVFDSNENKMDYNNLKKGMFVTIIAKQHSINHKLTFCTPLWLVKMMKTDYTDGTPINKIVEEWESSDEEDNLYDDDPPFF